MRQAISNRLLRPTKPKETTTAVAPQATLDKTNSSGPSFRQVLEQINSDWRSSKQAQDKALQQAMPKGNKEFLALLEAQTLVSGLHFKVHYLASAAESASGTIRRLQQLGAN